MKKLEFSNVLSGFFKVCLIFHLIFNYFELNAQVQMTNLSDSSRNISKNAMFFTNRPMQIKKGKLTFKDGPSKETNTLYMGWFNIENHNQILTNKLYNPDFDNIPTTKPYSNFFYDLYQTLRVENNIKDLIIFVPGFGKSFKKQTLGYMKDIVEKYASHLRDDFSYATFTWGTESNFLRYFRGQRITRRAATDFAIFQNSLDAFMSDSTFFENHPKDFKVHLITTSMAILMLDEYLELRQKAGIPFVQTYHTVGIFSGDISWKTFNQKHGLQHLDKFTKNSFLIINRDDILLTFTSFLNLRTRLGLKGPKKEVPFLKVIDVSPHLTQEDYLKLGHDYLFQNPWINKEIIQYFQSIR